MSQSSFKDTFRDQIFKQFKESDRRHFNDLNSVRNRIQLYDWLFKHKTSENRIEEAVTEFRKVVSNTNLAHGTRSDKITAFRALVKFVWQKFDGDYCASQYLVKLSQKTFDSALPMLVQMVAGTALWPDPKTINNIQGQQNNYITSPRHGVIYVRNVTQKKGLDLRDSNHCYDGKSYSTPVKADDNSQANTWLKKAILQMWELPTQCTPLFVNFTACHIWDSPDKVDYYLNLKNLILVPNVFAGLTDHHRSIMDILRYKSGLPNPKNNKSQALNTQEKTINQNLTWRNN